MLILKKIVAWPTIRVLFWTGHLFSKFATEKKFDSVVGEELLDIRSEWAFDMYQRFMAGSSLVQDWADLDRPWIKEDPYNDLHEKQDQL